MEPRATIGRAGVGSSAGGREVRSVEKLSPGDYARGSAMQNRVESLVARCLPGQTLPREFFSDEEIYRLDLDRIWRTGWLFAGHSCEIRNRGQYFTVEVGSDSIIVIRGEDNVLHALHNVCWHRGYLIC